MIEGFDKEIDAILRKARESEFAFENNLQNHLDADEISAFAENALPEKAKPLYTAHLADCDRCRRILSNIILLNLEMESVPAFVATKEVQAAPLAPWYRRLFAFPSLAYSLGALLLVFGGLIGFIALQSSNKSDVSQMNDKPFEPKSSSVSNATNNTAATSNATAPTNSANSATNSNTASVYSTNSTANIPSNTTSTSNSADSKQDVMSKERRQDAEKTEDGAVVGQAQEQPVTEGENKDITTRSLPTPAKKVERDEDTKTDKNQTPREEQKPKLSSPNSGATSGETMSVSGKTFNRRNNVWIDSEYRGQATTNITRGTNDYKKLDQDLQKTVERLGGTVVIVWKTRAYRIQ